MGLVRSVTLHQNPDPVTKPHSLHTDTCHSFTQRNALLWPRDPLPSWISALGFSCSPRRLPGLLKLLSITWVLSHDSVFSAGQVLGVLKTQEQFLFPFGIVCSLPANLIHTCSWFMLGQIEACSEMNPEPLTAAPVLKDQLPCPTAGWLLSEMGSAFPPCSNKSAL